MLVLGPNFFYVWAGPDYRNWFLLCMCTWSDSNRLHLWRILCEFVYLLNDSFLLLTLCGVLTIFLSWILLVCVSEVEMSLISYTNSNMFTCGVTCSFVAYLNVVYFTRWLFFLWTCSSWMLNYEGNIICRFICSLWMILG